MSDQQSHFSKLSQKTSTSELGQNLSSSSKRQSDSHTKLSLCVEQSETSIMDSHVAFTTHCLGLHATLSTTTLCRNRIDVVVQAIITHISWKTLIQTAAATNRTPNVRTRSVLHHIGVHNRATKLQQAQWLLYMGW